MNDLVGKTAALINQYYEYGTPKGLINDSDMYYLCYDVIFKSMYIFHEMLYSYLFYIYVGVKKSVLIQEIIYIQLDIT